MILHYLILSHLSFLWHFPSTYIVQSFIFTFFPYDFVFILPTMHSLQWHFKISSENLFLNGRLQYVFIHKDYEYVAHYWAYPDLFLGNWNKWEPVFIWLVKIMNQAENKICSILYLDKYGFIMATLHSTFKDILSIWLKVAKSQRWMN